MHEDETAIRAGHQAVAVVAGGPELTVVVPCYNERANVAPMVSRLGEALTGCEWEVVFVDDNSPDGTTQEARRLAMDDHRVRCIRRIGRRGLASAVIEGVLSSSAPFVAVMDGDLQHDETRLPEMLRLLREGVELVVGSRHVQGGADTGLSSPFRQRLSHLGIRIAQGVLPVRLSDPMSGFFAVSRPVFEQLAPRMAGRGFKILLDLVLAAPVPLKMREVPFQFRPRVAGESKLDILVLTQFAGMVLDKLTAGYIPLRFVAFACVGLVGVGVDVLVVWAGRRMGVEFSHAQWAGTLVAMIVNFQLNNSLTYRDYRLRGPFLWRGLALFMLVCGFGAVANVGIANILYMDHRGWTPAAAIGAAIGGVWNYAVSSTLVWRRVR